jgi:hypothetical protein
MSDRAPNVDVDPLLEALTRMLLAKSPDARPTSAKAARDLLDAIARDRPRAAGLLGVSLEDEVPSLRPPTPVPPLSSPGVPRYGTFTPPTPMLAVPQPLSPRARTTESVKRAAPNQRLVMWISIAVAALAVGAMLAVLLS